MSSSHSLLSFSPSPSPSTWQLYRMLPALALVVLAALALVSPAAAIDFPSNFPTNMPSGFSSFGSQLSFSGSDYSFNSSDSDFEIPITTLDPNLKPWQTRPPYTLGQEIKYNNGTIFYQRRAPGVIKVPFFTAYWWLAIIILVVVVVAIYALLCVWICIHFEKSEQKKAKKVVESAYMQDGFFDLDAYANATGMELKRGASARSVGSNESGVGSARGQPGNGAVPNPYVKRGSDSDSYSYNGAANNFRSPTGSPDERAFLEEDYEDDDDASSEDEYDAMNAEISSQDSRSTGPRPVRMPMGRRRSQN